jgi:hypothetical protein
VIAVAKRYASRRPKASPLRASADLVLAAAPLSSLVIGLALGVAGCLVNVAGMAASGAVVVAAGLYVERMQARALRRRRRAERIRNRHEVTELRRTIAQLRLDVGAFQRALLDTEAALAALSAPVAEPLAEPIGEPDAEPLVAGLDEPVHAWVQTTDRSTTTAQPTGYLSTSPTTKKVDPSTATMSATRQPGRIRESTWTLLNDADLSFSRHGTLSPRDTR